MSETRNKVKLIYDIASCPMSAGINMDEVIKLYKEEDIILYDSTENPGCREPHLLCIDEADKNNFKIVNLGEVSMQDLINNINRDAAKE